MKYLLNDFLVRKCNKEESKEMRNKNMFIYITYKEQI